EGAGVVVLEVSSHALAQSRVDGVEFDVAAFTNVSRDHLDYHADFEEYRATKARLSDRVKDDGVLVVNLDEPAWSILPDRHTRLGYGRVSEADYRAENVESTARGSRWTLVTPEGCGEVELPLPGDFNVDNALAAAATASTLEIPLERLVTGLSQAPPVPGRLEVLLD
ncbi:MAG: UDP-N-acetylmuramoyl-L-alanyl-D-glutamate--2,6-diaminopimelate ligase, partial [Gemmatimonadetes bacterium]|nr:UDP-N-acetylmuramoyl-L-alanyl-D-glutamate--2,6-diaminopimelate ligase [Gemmatimonadota bacterium]NIS31739.1 UDP-N-acetylmuramoyl-L-alanyl-D-glutamate--2,6-diaminopimelate ligase [Actinomycetota bacterium]NIU66839.1 UDP-N-acetylmuramoyl-L-alanyl-D-glutamate--2,6-diaminopimelate ligase [Actinomycetota bacterium]NIW28639.1 UDP-N-acetylmuramoyl-L-alanyl-D-glutamate--2,6-diaminopimelate ligase [Actinomycetota bacterium]NIX21101.1 UDP-N-acetylmuramoyl-L-alanyl-D-glutamate--2,6-diaminopimelate liga